MIMEYNVYPENALPEIEYDNPVKKINCGNCSNSMITNPGAHHPGLMCFLIRWLFKKKKIENGNECVNSNYGSCKFHNVTAEVVKAKLDRMEKKND